MQELLYNLITMSRNSLVPENFITPNNIKIGNYSLTLITTKDVIEDWLTLTSNALTIAKTRGANTKEEWPFVCGLEENYKDLAWLEYV